jgi:hypothetical protein
MSNDVPDPRVPLMIPVMFQSTNSLKMFFETNGGPVDVRVENNNSEVYCLVIAYRYSGVDTADFFCFMKANDYWFLFLNASFSRTPPGSIKFVGDGEFLNVIRKGKVVLKH